ncbi:MAG: hypothetical protein KME12_21705 [Trichocoleus desertorum ATA4-8-CV12]|jgi:hypothetical protein|nr:hypothetical protein [Trichocoleus desertorum ATA4-8-CV12]
MSDFDNVGQLMCLPLDDILPADHYSAPSRYIIAAAADALLKTEGHNWIPLIVEEVEDYKYQAVTNHFVYVVAAHAGLEELWCLVIKSSGPDIEQARILAGEVTPKIDLTTATRETIQLVLKHLGSQPGSSLKGVDTTIAATRIAAEDRTTWQDFTPIVKLKCGITKGKKLDTLAAAFYLSPPPPPPEPPSTISIKQASEQEIFERLNYLTTHKIGGFDTVDPEKVSKLVANANRSKWKSLNPITKMDCEIDAAKVKTLKALFTI